MAPTTGHTRSPDIDARLFRRTMGHFASGVTVVATHGAEGVHAMTANGFLSVSLDPPLVLVSLGRHTRMAATLDGSGHYGVSVLAEHQEAYSRLFAGQPTVDVRPEFTETDGIPLLDGALAHVGCRIAERVEAGDHVLYLGRVEYLDSGEGDPLVFYTGGYRVLHATANDEIFTH